MLYIDLNPKRACKVKHPKHNEFSSYAYYAHGKEDPLMTPAPSYLEMGITPERRQAAYRALIDEILKNDWQEKQPYSSVCFIGDPEWATAKHQELREIQKARVAVWKAIYRQRFRSTVP